MEWECACLGVQALMAPVQAAAISGISNPTVRAEALLFFLQTRVSNLVRPNGEHLATASVQAGAGVHLSMLWGEDAPFAVPSQAGLRVLSWYRAAIGPKDAFLSGLLMDVGHEVFLPDGTTVPNTCSILATAAQARVPNPRSHRPECNPGLVLLTQVIEGLKNIPAEVIMSNPNSRLADIYHGCANLERQGLPDSWPTCVEPAMLQGYHLLHVCQDPSDVSSFTYRLNVAHSALKSEVYLTSESTPRLMMPWAYDHRVSFIFNLPVLIIAPLTFKEGRHSFSLKSGLCSLKETVEYLAQV